MRGGRKPRRCVPARLETVAVGAFDGARELHSGRDVDLAEDVAQVSLDRLLAEEQLRGDLGIRLAVDDEPCHLELACSQRLDTDPVGLARPRTTVDAMPELSQLAFRLVAVAQRPACLELAGCALQLRGGQVTLAGLGEGAARERARQ